MRISKYKFSQKYWKFCKFTAASARGAKLVLGETYNVLIKALPRAAELEKTNLKLWWLETEAQTKR